MALQEYHFEFDAKKPVEPVKTWTHVGIVGSGDLEVFIEKMNLGGKAKVKIVTPTKGYEKVWRIIIERFFKQSRLGNVLVEINDNYATPLVVTNRLMQALCDLQNPEVED
jgi:malonate decarboxylase delta subunit